MATVLTTYLEVINQSNKKNTVSEKIWNIKHLCEIFLNACQIVYDNLYYLFPFNPTVVYL